MTTKPIIAPHSLTDLFGNVKPKYIKKIEKYN